MESFPAYEYMLEYAYVFPDSNIARSWNKYRDNLKQNISENTPIIRVEVPKKYTEQTFQNILGFIEKRGIKN
jgi:hypothetical protein